jgi:hypothetical protein
MTARPHSLPLRLVALILLVLALPVGAVALGTAAGLLPLPHPLWLVEQRLPVVFRLHMASAGLAFLAVPIAIAGHGLSLHKLVGRTAATLVLAGGLTALPVALASQGHWSARAGFLAQTVLWIALVLCAVRAIRRNDGVGHMWLMLGVAAIASGALWLRLATWAAARWGAPFDVAYALAAWLSWMLPLAAVALLARAGGYRSAPPAWRLAQARRDRQTGGVPSAIGASVSTDTGCVGPSSALVNARAGGPATGRRRSGTRRSAAK